MKGRINSYFAMLIVTVLGSGAALLIIHVAYSNNFAISVGGSEGSYASLQNSILNGR